MPAAVPGQENPQDNDAAAGLSIDRNSVDSIQDDDPSHSAEVLSKGGHSTVFRAEDDDLHESDEDDAESVATSTSCRAKINAAVYKYVIANAKRAWVWSCELEPGGAYYWLGKSVGLSVQVLFQTWAMMGYFQISASQTILQAWVIAPICVCSPHVIWRKRKSFGVFCACTWILLMFLYSSTSPG